MRILFILSYNIKEDFGEKYLTVEVHCNYNWWRQLTCFICEPHVTSRKMPSWYLLDFWVIWEVYNADHSTWNEVKFKIRTNMIMYHDETAHMKLQLLLQKTLYNLFVWASCYHAYVLLQRSGYQCILLINFMVMLCLLRCGKNLNVKFFSLVC